MNFTKKQVAAAIDHTALKANTRRAQVVQLCREAMEHGFGAVCVASMWVPACDNELNDAETCVCSVIGFPLGENLTANKKDEAIRAIEAGAWEIDMVMAVGAFLDGDYDYVREDIRAVAEAVHARGARLKVIIEVEMLDGGDLHDDQLRRTCQIIAEAGGDFAKTCTGFGGGEATVHDVEVMVQALTGTGVQVKASGGIKSWEKAVALLEAGATRLGTSSGVAIVTGAPADAASY